MVNEFLSGFLEENDSSFAFVKSFIEFLYFLILIQVGPTEKLIHEFFVFFWFAFLGNFIQIVVLVDMSQKSMVTNKVKIPHERFFFFCWRFFEFGFFQSFIELLIPFFFKFLPGDKSVLFIQNSGMFAVNRSIPLLLNFLVNFPDFPRECFFIEIGVVFWNQGSEKLREFFLFFIIGKELEGTIKNSTIV
jgi:hypothetical protein